jgi:D-sedoheptulose 7-phosphate isomerase
MQSFRDALDCLTQFCDNPQSIAATTAAIDLLVATFESGGKVLICGNGGSACDAMHFAEECTGRFRNDRRPLPAISLTDPAHLTCVANDFGFDQVFSRGIDGLGAPHDCVIVLSTSGQSVNIINALQTAKAKGLQSLALLGKDGGACRGLATVEWIVPGITSDRIQEIHMIILHTLIEGVERRLFPTHYGA